MWRMNPPGSAVYEVPEVRLRLLPWGSERGEGQGYELHFPRLRRVGVLELTVWRERD